MDSLNYITKLILNWFETMSFRFGMRSNLPGVGAGQCVKCRLYSVCSCNLAIATPAILVSVFIPLSGSGFRQLSI